MDETPYVLALAKQVEDNLASVRRALESVIGPLAFPVVLAEKVVGAGIGVLDSAIRPDTAVRDPRTGAPASDASVPDPASALAPDLRAVVTDTGGTATTRPAAWPTTAAEASRDPEQPEPSAKATAAAVTRKRTLASPTPTRRRTAKSAPAANDTAKKTAAKTTAKKATATRRPAKKAAAQTVTETEPSAESLPASGPTDSSPRKTAARTTARKTTAGRRTSKKAAEKTSVEPLLEPTAEPPAANVTARKTAAEATARRTASEPAGPDIAETTGSDGDDPRA